MQHNSIQIRSEIGQLKRVLVHRPGRELENLTPATMERLLFDDIPYLKIAREEHDAFCELLRAQGAEVVYLTDLVAESLTSDQVRSEFLREYLTEAGIRGEKRTARIVDYFREFSTKNMVEKLMEGVRKSEISGYGRKNLTDYLQDDYPFVVDPMPNLYFTRDPFACVGDGITLHRMHTVTRNRETLFAKYIFKHNPLYQQVPVYFDRTSCSSLEGGDLLVLSDKVIAVGISERTQPYAIEQLAKRVLTAESGFEQVLAIDIPKERAFMHLDTVFTMIDTNKFTMHPNIHDDMRVFTLTRGEDGHLAIAEEHGKLADILQKHLGLDSVQIIKCGGGSAIDAAREQWNDGSNTFAIAPNKVVAYSRNYVTNRAMEEAGVEVLTIPSSELSRGRGGPRCMTMPLIRESL